MQTPPSTGLPTTEDLFEDAPCGYLVLDRDGKIAKVNRTFCKWLAYSRDALLGQRFSSLLSVSGRISYETHFIPLLQLQGFSHEISFDLLAADGGRFAASMSAQLHGIAELEASIRITVFPALQRRRYERDLVEAREASEAARLTELETGKLREEFVAVLGHDLRNPLAALSAGVRALSREGSTERGARILGLMDGSIQRMFGLIDNVLDFARARLGDGIGLTRCVTEQLPSILTQVVEELSTTHPDRVIDVEFDLKAPVDCDPSRIAQLVSNLLGNAITHGAENRPVSITAVSSAAGDLTVMVSNEGPSIPHDAMERLFEPFVRGASRGYSEGLGLGLHIASEIAKAHGGTLTVSSSGGLTRFTLHLPGRPDPEINEADEPRAHRP
ncbi:HAMP domain-containing sensor histidine kinase [Rhizobium sp. NFR03]|uniref:PAS domain-containing sensor histidine kinase n=1 Tax=Rhizobium sp. NFR03 TaxID=1566263 RepID=UPI0008CA9AD5|nr:HAMP domain-containing sensor histidine kinase [Rhizobium sp. NFR03]SES47439.1 sigma-B regulation protein RsbU (phosphoserine phosphatase) [Rhizobium sp. NFR03]